MNIIFTRVHADPSICTSINLSICRGFACTLHIHTYTHTYTLHIPASRASPCHLYSCQPAAGSIRLVQTSAHAIQTISIWPGRVRSIGCRQQPAVPALLSRSGGGGGGVQVQVGQPKPVTETSRSHSRSPREGSKTLKVRRIMSAKVGAMGAIIGPLYYRYRGSKQRARLKTRSNRRTHSSFGTYNLRERRKRTNVPIRFYRDGTVSFSSPLLSSST